MSITTANFVEALRSWGLLETPQLNELSGNSAVRLADPRHLARRLMDRGLLTPYQVNQVLSGRSEELVLGSYVLLERLGEGGMGQVFKARHQKLGRIVALKVIRKDRLSEPHLVHRFRREIEIVSQLSHPNIVMAYDADQVGGTNFFVMEYVEGETLSRLVKRCGPRPAAQACEYIRQAALGLQHAHERGLVHRDIKPSNLLVTHAWGKAGAGRATDTVYHVIKIMDLGLARLNLEEADGEAGEMLTRAGVLMGTPDFIAAEQAANPHAADIRSDLYSLGCTLYYALTGSVPFPGGTHIDKLFKHRCDDPEAVERRNPLVPRTVGDIVRKLMAKRPEDRYQTPAEAAQALSALLQTQTPAATRHMLEATLPDLSAAESATPSVPMPAVDALAEVALERPEARRSAGRARRPAARRRVWWTLGGVAVLLAVVGMVWVASGWSGESGTAMAPATQPVTTDATALRYVRRSTRNETILATLKANGLPTLEGKWYYIGPFNNSQHNNQWQGFHAVYPPEKEIKLTATYKGKGDQPVSWKELTTFRPGEVVDLRLFKDNDAACVYLYHEITVETALKLPVALGSDDTLTVWLNGERLVARDGSHQLTPGQDRPVLALRPGKNQLLVKVCNMNGTWAIHALPQFPPLLETAFGDSLRRDFPGKPGK